MITDRGHRPRFFRAIHNPYSERTISNQQIDAPVHQEDVVSSTLKQCKKLTNTTKDQYIKLRNSGANGLPYSAKLLWGDAIWKLHGEGCLVTIGSDYVAQVSIESIPELNDASDFEASKELLLAHLKTVNVLFDQLNKETTDIVGVIESLLHDLATDCATYPNSVKCLLEFWRIANKYNFKISVRFSEELDMSEVIQHNQLKTAIKEYVQKHQKLQERNLFQKSKSWIQGFSKKNNFLEEFLKSAIKNHAVAVLEICPLQLKQSISILKPPRSLLLGGNDVKLFSDLECVLNESVFKEVLPKIQAKFIKRVNDIKLTECYQFHPLVNTVYFHVCKSMLEIANLVQTELSVQKPLTYENEWMVTNIESSEGATLLTKSYVTQLQKLVEIANHLEPGKLTVGENFPYELQIKLFKSSKSIHKNLRIWLCLVDATMMKICQGKTERIEAYSVVLQRFVKFVSSKETRSESQESLRLVAHNTLDFVAHVEQSGLGNNTVDTEILQKQISLMGPVFPSDSSAFSRYRDILDVFKNYWQRFNEVLPKLANKLEGDHLKPQVDEIRTSLTNIVSQVLNKNAQSEDVIEFFRAYNDLFTDLEDLTFEWYVRIPNREIKEQLLQNTIIKRVENSLSNTDNECYQVQKDLIDEFIKIFAANEIPKYYPVEIVKTLLIYINETGQKQAWINGQPLSDKCQLAVTVLLINAVRSSLLYLKEQPDYIDFETFLKETIQPFSCVINQSDSLEDFTKRVELIKESFWYIRNQNSIGIDKALQLFTPHNENVNEELLKSSFVRYHDQFLKYMAENSVLNSTEKIENIVQDVRTKVKPMLSSEWTTEFKQTVLPEILAGLGSVWSIMISKDVASSGKYLQPHSIQILSILRLLSVDRETTGVEKHLAQILTGQGKSLVLGLSAALLALFNHDVVVVCYSKYLASRDFNDFKGLFQNFAVNSKIYYQTFGDVAWNEMHNLYEKATKYVSKCIGIPDNKQKHTSFASNLENTVLLIDEVDVFFLDKFYGSTYNPLFLPIIHGLGKVQQQIWKFVQQPGCDVKHEIDTFMRHSNEPDIIQLKSLLQRSRQYTLIDMDKEATEVQQTNMSLFSEHLEAMINTAKAVNELALNDDLIRSFRLDSDGNITHKDELGVFRPTTLKGYYNAFMYFKLRENNFVQSANGVNNFGYLLVKTASYSYSKIPEKFPLILGVTGTLSELNAFEKDAIENHYKISQSSLMPSFFGNSNLKFNPIHDFQCHNSLIEWRQVIFSRINAIINAQRAVIVFFDSESEIADFRKDFQSQLDRLNEITINTEAKTRDRFIAEAGLSRTVTLATREMGRGVDYKSSLSVEKNGGIHVIQTFFSLDDKEETQIKGRTARKDNRGSYELIVCQTHLASLKLTNLVDKVDTISYARLLDSRKNRTSKKSTSKIQKLNKANELHEKSNEFYRNIDINV
ncbi:uncharacterized protein LOC109408796 [Aedes albopictus]|uniref:SecA family profile domain-containing protein n=1 Tax=Aedes albopictus TaxID=7160 RepID=A0ABM1Y751_AEDAL